MHITCGSRGVIDNQRPAQGIRDIAGAGYQGLILDLSMLCLPYELENLGKANPKPDHGIKISENPEALHEGISRVLEQCEKMQISTSIVRAPYLDEDTKRDDLNSLLEQLALESIRVCGRAGGRYVIIRSLFAGIAKDRIAQENKDYYLRLADAAKEQKVQILLENQCRDLNGHSVRGFCSEGTEAAWWVDDLNREAGQELFGFCMDVGTCSLCGMNMYDFSLSLGERLKAVILREYGGDRKNSMLPFTGTGRGQTDWLNLIRGLRGACFDGELVMDFAGTMAVSPVILKPEWIRMSKLAADYFKWQIEMESVLKKYPSRVLFGAGNMCRNYMKCYGEQYPPLFTCDNNKMMWEKEFCGLKVKSPESIKELPKDCAIFICNIYYREIEAQLRDMEISNPIEYFNDEYMPSFYFDRLDVEARENA